MWAPIDDRGGQVSDESEESPTPDRLFPDEDPIFLDRDEPEIPEAAELPPATEPPDGPVGEPVGLPSARNLKPGEFHRPPPDLSSLPAIAAYEPAEIDTGDDDSFPSDEPSAEVTIDAGTIAAAEPDEDEVPEIGDPAGLSSARDLKPGEFHRPPPQLSSLPKVAAYHPAELDPADDGMADFVEAPPDPEEPEPAVEPTESAVELGPPTAPGRLLRDDELPVYPPIPRPGEIEQPPAQPPPPPPPPPVDAPRPIDPGPPPPPPKIRVGPPPPPPGVEPPASGPIAPPTEAAAGPGLPVRDSPPARPPIRTEIPNRGGVPLPPAAAPPTGPAPSPGRGGPPVPPSAPHEPRRRPEPELTMEDLIAASTAQHESADRVDWLSVAEASRGPSKRRQVGVIVAVALTIAIVLGLGAAARQRDDGAGTDPGNDTALLAVDPDGTPDAPFGIGDWAEIGGGWWLSVADAEVEAEAVLRDAADFNPAPRNGGYALASLDLHYAGDTPTTLFDLTLDAVAPSGRTHSAFDCRATEPHPLDRRVDIFPGATMTGDECFDVALVDRSGLLLAVSSGSGSEPVYFSFSARGSSEVTPPDPPAAPHGGGPGSRGTPIALGEAADVGGNWLLRVDRVARHAERDLVGANPFNEPPVNGAYALAEVTAVYTGPGESDALDMRFNAIGAHNIGYSSAGCAAAEPKPFPGASTVSTRGALSGQVCFDIDPEDSDALVLYARGTPDALPVFFSTGS
jgi:hypothetical protein